MVTRIDKQLPLNHSVPFQSKNTENGSFAKLFKDALSEVNNLQLEADSAYENFALGRTDNIHEVLSVMQEAQLALQLTVQIRNKLTEAYQDIMRMQI